MTVIAQGVAGVVLHMAKEDVVPIKEVEGSVWGEFEIDRSDVAVRGRK